MSILSHLVLEMYWDNANNGKGVGKLNEDLIKKQLNEITRWEINAIKSPENISPKGYSFRPKNPPEDIHYIPIEVRLVYDSVDDSYELKFGNLNEPDDEKRYYWNTHDKYKIQKSLFIKDVFEKGVFYSLLNKEKINKIKFKPYDGDNLGSNRLAMFKNIFEKLNTNNDYDMYHDNNYWYIKKLTSL